MIDQAAQLAVSLSWYFALELIVNQDDADTKCSGTSLECYRLLPNSCLTVALHATPLVSLLPRDDHTMY